MPRNGSSGETPVVIEEEMEWGQIDRKYELSSDGQ